MTEKTRRRAAGAQAVSGAVSLPAGVDAAEAASIDTWLWIAEIMLVSRALDNVEEDELTPANKIGLQFSALGHELIQAIVAAQLTHPHDAATAYYRSRPFMLASGLTPTEALRASMARGGGLSDGRDVGVVFNLPRRHGATVLPMSGNVGAQYPVAAGWAQAIRYRQRELGDREWDGAIAVAMGGDGSVATNGFWSALNATTPQNLPMLFVVEDNGYSISVPSHLQTPGGNIAANLASYRHLAIWDIDGTDPAEAWRAVSAAVAHVRSGDGVALVRASVPRIRGHAFNDNQAYRSSNEILEDQARDPWVKLADYLTASGVDRDRLGRLETDVEERVAAAVAEADRAAGPDPNTVTSHLFARSEAVPEPSIPDEDGPRLNMMEGIRRALDKGLATTPTVMVFGEDVGQKGGVHSVTKGLQQTHGAGRVFDTSLSEDGIMGRALGMALSGLSPVPEIQFRKYADPGHEQIADIGTVRWRTAGHFRAPMVLRMPVGYGKRCGDPWHSVNGEAVYAHTLGWHIVYPSNAADATGLLRSALASDDPVMFLEHRALLDSPLARRPYPGDDYVVPLGRGARLAVGAAVTVVTWGAMVYRCLEAAAGYEGRVELIDLRTIIPWDRDLVLESVSKTGKVVIVHEDTVTAGFGAEIAATIGREAFEFLDAPITRVATLDCPTPYNRELMAAALPSVERIRGAINETLRF